MGLLKNADDWKKIETTPTIYYESFFNQYKGDHRAMVIDVPSKILFENYRISPFYPIYSLYIYIYLLCQNIPRRIDQLLKHKKTSHKEAEKIDKQITAGCKHGEKKCHQCQHEYWTVEIHKIRCKLVIWCTLKYRKNRS